MAILNLVGLETGGGTEQSGSSGTTSTPTTSASTFVYSGSRSLRTNPTTTAVGYRAYGTPGAGGAESSFSVSTIYFSYRFRYTTAPAANDEENFSIYQATNHRFSSRLSSTGNLVLYDRVLGALATSSTALAADTWYRISGNVVMGTVGSYDVKIRNPNNDSTILETLSGSADTGTTNFTSIRYGKAVDRNGNTVDFFYDDMIQDDATEPPNWGIVMARPTANGSTMQWASGTGASDYQEVNEVPVSATQYVMSDGTASQLALFAFQNLSDLGISGATIKAVKLHNRVREDVSGTSSNVGRIKSGATNADSTARDISATAIETSKIFETDPDISAAWTEAGFNAVEAGSFETNAIAIRMESIGLMVLYDASTIPQAKTAMIM